MEWQFATPILTKYGVADKSVEYRQIILHVRAHVKKYISWF